MIWRSARRKLQLMDSVQIRVHYTGIKSPCVFATNQRSNGGMAWMLLTLIPVIVPLPNIFWIVLPQNNLLLKFFCHSILYILSKYSLCRDVMTLSSNAPDWMIKSQRSLEECMAIDIPLPQSGVIRPALSPHIRIWFSTKDLGAKEKSLITSGLGNRNSELWNIRSFKPYH